MFFYFPIHIDGDNRGCEGIAKGTALLLGKSKAELLGLCRNVPVDKKLGIDKYVTLVPYKKNTLINRIFNRIISSLGLNLDYRFVDVYKQFIERMKKEDIMISTGGDMMCYGDCEVNTTNNQAYSKGCKTILWGCSMGPENLTPKKEETLHRFSLIYARESLSYDFFKSLGLKNVVCYPDPAFILKPEVVQLPHYMDEGEIVGINISNYTIKSNDFTSPFGKEFVGFVKNLLRHSAYKVLLIPHVLWRNQDDRILCELLASELSDFSERVYILETQNYNYLQIRYIISKLYCFIGSRTHAVISAYSTCIPTIALGYSIKARGIAKDLGLPMDLVLDTRNEKDHHKLSESFNYLESHYDEIKKHLINVVPNYCNQTYGIQKDIRKLIDE